MIAIIIILIAASIMAIAIDVLFFQPLMDMIKKMIFVGGALTASLVISSLAAVDDEEQDVVGLTMITFFIILTIKVIIDMIAAIQSIWDTIKIFFRVTIAMVTGIKSAIVGIKNVTVVGVKSTTKLAMTGIKSVGVAIKSVAMVAVHGIKSVTTMAMDGIKSVGVSFKFATKMAMKGVKNVGIMIYKKLIYNYFAYLFLASVTIGTIFGAGIDGGLTYGIVRPTKFIKSSVVIPLSTKIRIVIETTIDHLTTTISSIIRMYSNMVCSLVELCLDYSVQIQFYSNLISSIFYTFLHVLKEDWNKNHHHGKSNNNKKKAKMDKDSRTNDNDDDSSAISVSTASTTSVSGGGTPQAEKKKIKRPTTTMTPVPPPQEVAIPTPAPVFDQVTNDRIAEIEKEFMVYAPKVYVPKEECIGCFNFLGLFYQGPPPTAFYPVEED